MKRLDRYTRLTIFSLLFASFARSQSTQMQTYCNPINIDYSYMIYNAGDNISYRSGADPVVVKFRGEYYMFVTRSMGYWHSKDLTNWDFITPENWYFKGSNAPAAANYKDSILYVAGDPSGSMNVLYTDDPKRGNWKGLPYILRDLQDPDLFLDDDGSAYMYWGSSNVFAVRGRVLDRNRAFREVGKTDSLFYLDGENHGWERFGENNSDTVLSGYIEGPWMTKHNGRYYLQYAAPGTEFNVYADGYYIGDAPLGPFQYAPNNPFSLKPGGFITGAGHGSTVQGLQNQYWHFTTMTLGVNVNWERRIGVFPTFFDDDGLLYSDTYFGDYPHYSPAVAGKKGRFRGWMLLSYKKPVTVSSGLDNFPGDNLTDENIKTYWVAQENDSLQWVTIDLQKSSEIYAIQVNYNDYKSDYYTKIKGLRYRYLIETSLDGLHWDVVLDKRDSYEDTPHDYSELPQAVQARYVRYKNIGTPTPYLSLSEIRIFGKGNGKIPNTPKNLKVSRAGDKRNAVLTWNEVNSAQGYNVFWGTEPDKMYHSWQVYDWSELEIPSLDARQTYYFSVEAFNENGVGKRSKVVRP